MTDRDLEAAIDAARAYCATIDQRHLVELSAFLTAAHRDISRLYARIVALPEIEPSETGYDRPEDAWTELYHDLQGMLGPIDNYREIFDPYGDEHEPPVVGSLSDAMAVVYADAMRAISVADVGSQADSGWELQLALDISLGHHALDAMRALHAHRFDTPEEPHPASDDAP